MYDVLFTASTYKSAQNALRLIKSIQHIEGNHICVIVTPLQSDVDELAIGLFEMGDIGCRAVVFHSAVDHLYQGRGWGFAWAVANGIAAKYLCSCDDDIEFMENSHDIVTRLNMNEFSIMTFFIKGSGYKIDMRTDFSRINTERTWLNGDTMFSHFEDNLQYGVADALLDYPVSYFTEIEYQHRMSYFTGRWLLVDMNKHFYYHHSREPDDELTQLRSQHAATGIATGKRLWMEKYNINVGDGHTFDCQWAYEQISTMPEKMKSHYIFHGLWNDWNAIYEKIKSQFTLAIDTGSKEWV